MFTFKWFKALALVMSLAFGSLTPYFTLDQYDSGEALRQLGKIAYDNAMARVDQATAGCTKDKVKVRKEWRNMTLTERKGYQEAVQCLMQKPSRNNITGAKTAWDDYGVLHYYQAPYVHNDAAFLLWHRHYNWALEQDLLINCDYTGTFPYWEWGLDCGTLDQSPVFDGSEYSLGSNGVHIPGHPPTVGGANPGSGGGCLKSGPFANFTVHLGPQEATNPLAYNPRCIKRDLNDDVCSKWASLRNTTEAIIAASTISAFQGAIQGGDVRNDGGMIFGDGVHLGGHFSISGDPGSDFHFSALEPAFYLHHGNIDRMHFIWQNLDWDNRQKINGTRTMNNVPPSDPALLTDVMHFEPIARDVLLGDAMDTVGGNPLCYVYESW